VLPLEDHISRAVRRHIPDVLEKAGALPDRLRLLSLPGEERSAAVLAGAADLLKGDAGNAAAVLGGAECPIPAEINWALAVVEALDGGAEADVRKARLLLESARELEGLFPGSTADILADRDRDTAGEVLGSERFFERLPDLRGVIRGLSDGAARHYRDERDSYEGACKAGVTVLEADLDWPKLSDEDREEIASRLRGDMPPEPDASNPVRSLQTLFVRRSALPGLVEQLKQEIQKRKPKQPEPEPEGEPKEEEVVTADMLIEPVVISNAAELDGWLAGLRGKLAGILQAGKKLLIRK